ncbi:MAG: GNAT family N-acetyltransferase [Defluviitaleaceae bacterium]|nr:GNAT family N-acetyltransferase [Defluviitaleaceae bacterium]
MVKNYNEILHKNQTLESERLILRKFKEEDAADILEWGSDSEVLRHLVWPGVTTLEQARAGIYNYLLSQPGIYAIELKETGKCIGDIDLRIKPEHSKLSFGYVLNRSYWGKGYMTETLKTIIKFAFEQLQANRVAADHFGENLASGRVMEKAGMKREGITKQSIHVRGKMHDQVWYGLVREDYLKGEQHW